MTSRGFEFSAAERRAALGISQPQEKPKRERGVIRSTLIHINTQSGFTVANRDRDGNASVVELQPGGGQRYLLHLPVGTAEAVCRALNAARDA